MTTTETESLVQRAEAREIVELAIAQLEDHPKHDHVRDEVSVRELAASIARHGQLQPAIVQPREGGAYRVLAGHRRKWAREQLGLESMPCVVAEVDDASALAILIATNEDVEDPDPLREADAVDALMHPMAPGAIAWSVDQVASALGRTRRWVARRAQLRNISPKLVPQIRAGKLWKSWPVEWLEQIAVLARSAQEELALELTGNEWSRPVVSDQEDLDELLAERLHVLGKAPFDPTDAELVPKAGACFLAAGAVGSPCRKTTASRPGLFDDETDGDPRTARCCDAACWKAKAAAGALAAIAAAKEKHPKDLVVVDESGGGGGAITDELREGVNLTPHYNVEEVRGTAKGAVPAVFVTEAGGTREGFVRRFGGRSTGGRQKPAAKPKAEQTPAERLKASREHVRRRRLAHVVDAVGEHVRHKSTPTPPLEVVLRFVAAYEVQPPFKGEWGDVFHGDVKRARAYAEKASDPEAFAALLWARVRKAVAQSISRHGSQDLDGEYALAAWIAEQLGLSQTVLDVTAKVDVPDPKWWPATEAKPKRKAAKRGKAKAAAAEEPGLAGDGLHEIRKGRKS